VGVHVAVLWSAVLVCLWLPSVLNLVIQTVMLSFQSFRTRCPTAIPWVTIETLSGANNVRLLHKVPNS